MVNLVTAQKPLVAGFLKLAGLKSQVVEIEEGTVMHFWLPKKRKSNKKAAKPAVVLVHGFAAEGTATWQFQASSLSKKFDVYIPDLIFFGEHSVSRRPERGPEFQAECLVKALKLLGVERCGMVGFSYGGMVASRIAASHPDLVGALVLSGSVPAMTDSLSDATLQRLGFTSSSELLLPNHIKGLKALLSVAVHRKLWFPDRLYRDYLEAMFTNRKEREELLEALVKGKKEADSIKFSQNVLLLWGEDDQIFKMELAKSITEKLGDKASFQGIKKAGHLVQLERPCKYNRKLKQFLIEHL
ncbi:uncharacterized protein LOC116263881 [Nymphaea colorata]|nr:uncharacterized protein LOC116263881 [Nymphaea colorata]